MEPYYKQVPDGVKIPMDEAKTLLDLIQLAYPILVTQGTMTQDQIQLCENLKNIVYSVQ
jgi:hypothetical protein